MEFSRQEYWSGLPFPSLALKKKKKNYKSRKWRKIYLFTWGRRSIPKVNTIVTSHKKVLINLNTRNIFKKEIFLDFSVYHLKVGETKGENTATFLKQTNNWHL